MPFAGANLGTLIRQKRAVSILVAAFTISGLACRPAEGPEPSNILLITIDTLRADHLSSYGYARATSPTLDRLASEGIRFETASVQWPKTGPSIASMMTATYPKDNGIVRRVGTHLPPEFRLLAEELRHLGYQTAAVVANATLGRAFRFDQGFDHFVEMWKLADPDRGGENTHAGVVRAEAIELARTFERDRPFFLWLHFIDPHTPYAPPEGWRDAFQDDGLFPDRSKLEIPVDEENRRSQLGALGAARLLEDRRDLGFYLARYDAEIRYVDAQVGLLLDELGEMGLLRRTLTAVTSDHGEALGEHRYFFGHGRLGLENGLHVPLIFHYPGVLTPRVEKRVTEVLDLAPTLLEFAGAELHEGQWMQGRSLASGLRSGSFDDRGEPRYAFSEAGVEKRGSWQKIVRGRRFKLIHAPSEDTQEWLGGRGNEFVLYDLESDPAEEVDVSERFGERADVLRRALARWYRAESFEVRVDSGDGDASEVAPMDDQTRKQLEALGYLH